MQWENSLEWDIEAFSICGVGTCVLVSVLGKLKLCQVILWKTLEQSTKLVPLILLRGQLVILISCTFSLSPFLDVTRMFMSIASVLTQLDSECFCLSNSFFWLIF